jgi:hypothetical protein
MINAVIDLSHKTGESLSPDILAASFSHDLRCGHIGYVERNVADVTEEGNRLYRYQFDILNFDNERTSLTGIAEVQVQASTGRGQRAELVITDKSRPYEQIEICLSNDVFLAWRYGRDLERLLPEDQRSLDFHNRGSHEKFEEMIVGMYAPKGLLSRIRSLFGKKTGGDNN